MWATATGPGIFRSLGFKNPSGYWLLRRSTYSHTGIGGCGQRLGACMCGLCVCRCVRQTWPGGKMASPTMIGPPPPAPPLRASNLRPRDETPVHFQYATLPMWWETPPIPPAVGIWHALGGAHASPPAPRARHTNINTLIGRPAPSPPRAAMTQRTAGPGPRALSGMLLPQTPTANNPPRWNPSIYCHNTRTTHCEPPQATLRESNPRRPASGPLMIPLYYTEDTRYLPLKTQGTLTHHRGGGSLCIRG